MYNSSNAPPLAEERAWAVHSLLELRIGQYLRTLELPLALNNLLHIIVIGESVFGGVALHDFTVVLPPDDFLGDGVVEKGSHGVVGDGVAGLADQDVESQVFDESWTQGQVVFELDAL